MKRFYAVIVILSFLLSTGCAETGKDVQKDIQKEEDSPEIQLYTAYNIWRLRAYLMRCINYKYGNKFIPAGSKVRDVKISDDANGTPRISFVTADDNRKYGIYFTGRWHPGHTIDDYKNYMFTTKTFEELTAGMSDREISAIRSGTVVDGMSKAAVLVAYGRPPEHRTPSLQREIWYYWQNKFRYFEVCFDEEDRTTFCK
jgi:hypothetical protein